ncbi:MAG: Alpha/beta hydrolase [Magnetococcales bacterium]|nr:Alpha/beta hydrolase [Magnetococcales bacterium]HIJ84535.1 alpha/beta hydrolase [Magnetococcales bacterium]
MPSLRGRFVRWLVRRVAAKGTTYVKPVSQQRQEMEDAIARIKVSKKVSVQPVVAAGIPGEWIIPKKNMGKRTLLYCHGGGYFKGSLATHRAFMAHLALLLEAQVFHFAYRLAPEHPFPAAVEDGLAVYRWLLSTPMDSKSIIIAGESAGGNLVLTTLLGARHAGLPLPAAAVCISPHFDFSFSQPAIRDNAESEVLYTLEELKWMRGIYLGPKADDERLWRHDMVSPLFADLSGLPPLLLHADSTEMLRDDAVAMASRASAAGVVVELKVWRGLFHAFHLFTMIPEAKRALAEIRIFAEKYWRVLNS